MTEVSAEIGDLAPAIESNSTSRQVEAPASVGNSTSLLDRSSAPAVLGVALNLAGLSGDFSSGQDSGAADAVSVTTTAYVIQSAAMAQNPLNPSRYCTPMSKRLRRVALSAGQEEVDTGGNGTTEVDRASSFGVKVTFHTERDACDYQGISVEQLKAASLEMGDDVVRANAALCADADIGIRQRKRP